MGEKDKAKKGDGGGAKGDAPTTVLKLDLHCEGCAKKVKRLVRHFDGVVDVKADATNNKLMVTGSVDPAELREKVSEKTGKNVELLSPQPMAKKDAGGGGGKGGEKPAEKKKPSEDTKKAEPKPVPTSTVVLKIRLHCDGCTKKIKRVIAKTKGVDSIDVDVAKELITVKGAIETKEFVSYLKDKLKRSVEVVVPPKKEEGGGEKKEVKKDEGGGEKKEKQGNDGEKKEKESGGDKKKEGGNEKKENGGGEKKEAGDKGKSEASKMDHHYGYPQYSHYTEPIKSRGFMDEGYNSMVPHYNQGYNYPQGYSSQGYTTQVYANQSYSTPSSSYTQTYPNHGHNVEYSHQPPQPMYYQAPPPQGDYLHAPPPHGDYMHVPPPQGDYLHAPPTPAYVHAPQMFSDENPNACSVM